MKKMKIKYFLILLKETSKKIIQITMMKILLKFLKILLMIGQLILLELILIQIIIILIILKEKVIHIEIIMMEKIIHIKIIAYLIIQINIMVMILI